MDKPRHRCFSSPTLPLGKERNNKNSGAMHASRWLMYNPELLTAYIIAGAITSTMLFTAFKIVRSASAPQASSRKSA
jgi:hypothetical protein